MMQEVAQIEDLDPLQQCIMDILALAPCDDSQIQWALRELMPGECWSYEDLIGTMEAEGHIAYDGCRWAIATADVEGVA